MRVTDLFAGIGGSSTGAVAVPGIELRLALNHWRWAVDIHNANHPYADHYLGNVREVDPRRFERTDILLASPTCTDHSQAKTFEVPWSNLGQLCLFPDDARERERAIAERQSRATMWDVVEFTAAHRYELVIVENVVEVCRWEDFMAWLREMSNLGYHFKTLYLNAMFFHDLNGVHNCDPIPQSRDRFFCVFWKEGNRAPDLEFRPQAWCARCEKDVEAVQSWKNPRKRWGKYGERRQYVYRCPTCAGTVEPYYYAAVNAIDFSIPIQKVADKQPPVSANTRRRIRAGLDRFGAHPLIVNMDGRGNFSPGNPGKYRSALLGPLFTLTGSGNQRIAIPPVIVMDLTRSNSIGNDPNHVRSALSPLFTLTTKGTLAFALPAFLIELYGNGTARAIADPLPVVTTSGSKAGLLIPFIATYNGNAVFKDVIQPLPTVAATERHGLVVPGGEIDVDDCYYRTLRAVPELRSAMGFPQDYILDGSVHNITRGLGNAVPPGVMNWLVSRAVASLA
jgi:DNA (cytosine-5)-methyltransferase 1